MSDRHFQFRGWLAHLDKLNKAGPLDVSDMQAEARRKREAGETFAQYNARMLRLIHRDPWRDHDAETEIDNPLRNA